MALDLRLVHTVLLMTLYQYPHIEFPKINSPPHATFKGLKPVPSVGEVKIFRYYLFETASSELGPQPVQVK
jgi:hypothetical protein